MIVTITKDRYDELGLGIDKESCTDYLFCWNNDDKEHKGLCCDAIPNMTIDEAIEAEMDCPNLDNDRLRAEMTDEEYDAWRHNRLRVKH